MWNLTAQIFKGGIYFQVLYCLYRRVYTSPWMGSRESFEEQSGLHQLTTWPASCLGGTNNFHLPFVIAAIYGGRDGHLRFIRVLRDSHVLSDSTGHVCAKRFDHVLGN